MPAQPIAEPLADHRADPPVVVPASARVRMAWTFADQGLSSLTNAALALVVADAVSRIEFGAFSLALVTFSFVIGLGRSLIGDCYVVRFTGTPRRVRRRAAAHATGAAIVFGAAAGVLCAVAGALLPGQARLALFALAISLPGLMWQETWRHAFFAAGRPAAAALNDLIWAGLQVVLLGVLLLRGSHSIFWITLAWGASALVAAVAGVVQTGVRPRPGAALGWFRETRDLNVRMGLDFVLNMGAINLALFFVGGIVGVVGVGALRAAQVLLGPLNLLFAGLSAFVLPMLARRAGTGGRLTRAAVAASLGCGAIAAGWVAVLLLLPAAAGRHVLGDSWAGARSVLAGSGAVQLAVACVIGASLGLKALRRADRMLRVTFFQAPVMLGLGALGAWYAGASGAAVGFAVAQGLGLVVCWVVFLRADAAPRSWVSAPDDMP
jgi:O-antigen/teichoic acid export membrane protein